MTYRLGNFHNPEGGASRVRKAFNYPEDESGNGADNMDEEEQEKLIKKLKTENDAKNELWIKYLLAVTIFSFLPFLPSFMKSRALQPKMLCILSITSIFATAYMLIFIPTKKSPGGRPNRPPALSPVQKYLPYLNGALSLLVGFNGLGWRDRTGVHDGFWILSWLPSVVFAMVVFARRVLVEVDPDELWNLQYDLKGA